jgi:hypothetical protein
VIALNGVVVAVANPTKASSVRTVTFVSGVPDIKVMYVIVSVVGFVRLGVVVTSVTTVCRVPDMDVVNVARVVVA